ncbi:hypothetical protein [Persephonella sp.]
MNKKLKIALGIFLAFVVVLFLIPSENENSAKTEVNNLKRAENLSPEKKLLKKLIDESFDHYRKEFVKIGNSLIEMVDSGNFSKQAFFNHCDIAKDIYETGYSKLRENLSKTAKKQGIYDKYLNLYGVLKEEPDCVWLPTQALYYRIENLCEKYEANPDNFQIDYEIFKKKFIKYRNQSENLKNECLNRLMSN